MNFLRSAAGEVRVRLISADTAKALKSINASGISVSKVRQKDGLTVEFRISRSQLRELNRIVQHRGDRIELTGREGIYWGLRRLIRRPVLVTGVLIMLLLTLYLPTRVLFIQVEGNTSIPTRMILEAAQNCGICFGANARQVRSEKMKNALLEQIPQLQWAGINTDGCCAVISVREKTEPDKTPFQYPISSMVAMRDGYITQMIVTAGSPLCKVGQTVKAGQVLISAYTDCGLHIQATKAKGEVFANTQREFQAATLSSPIIKGKVIGEQRSYGLIIGKKQINFTKGSGISGRECDRIKKVEYLSLPGGFRLPVAFVTQTEISYSVDEGSADDARTKLLLSSFVKEYLTEDMVAGQIEQCVEQFMPAQGTYLIMGRYRCNEMICKTRAEEILQSNE